MKVLIGCDVDPILPVTFSGKLNEDVWDCLGLAESLVDQLGDELPPITWLIRADESVRVASGNFASGYFAKRSLWSRLIDAGHELGWHMHLMSFDDRQRGFEFDPTPVWLRDAYGAINECYPVRVTRTGWGYGSNWLYERFLNLGIEVDFSAMPGSVQWYSVGSGVVEVDWLRAPLTPYRMSSMDYQRPGDGSLVEIPVAQFDNPLQGMAKRLLWRFAHGTFSLAGLRKKTRLLTERWGALPRERSPIWAFYFHPEDLQGEGLTHFKNNMRHLRALPKVEFVTASSARTFLLQAMAVKPPSPS